VIGTQCGITPSQPPNCTSTDPGEALPFNITGKF
jgi:hypothetical protein